MNNDFVTVTRTLPGPLDRAPAPIAQVGEHASRCFFEFFTAIIRNANTRAAYFRAAMSFFNWCEERDVRDLRQMDSMVVTAYLEHLGQTHKPPTVKQHLAAIRMLFDWLVVGHVLQFNPATSVRGPKYVVRRGKAPVLDAEQARQLLDSIDTSHVVGLRDRALIAVMVYSFARIGAVVGMCVEDYYQLGEGSWLRLHEKGGKPHEVPAHHNAEFFLDTYVQAAGIRDDKHGPLFRTAAGRTKKLTMNRMHRTEALLMIKRRASEAGLSKAICCHTFRATGITAYLDNGGTIEKAQQIAGHESPKTTKLYDRTSDKISVDEIERIAI